MIYPLLLLVSCHSERTPSVSTSFVTMDPPFHSSSSHSPQSVGLSPSHWENRTLPNGRLYESLYCPRARALDCHNRDVCILSWNLCMCSVYCSMMCFLTILLFVLQMFGVWNIQNINLTCITCTGIWLFSVMWTESLYLHLCHRQQP